MNINVIGQGKLGLPLATVLVRAGYDVTGIDRAAVIDRIRTSPYEYRGVEELKFSDHPTGCDVTFVVVPTPSNPNGHFDDQNVRQAIGTAKSSLVVLVSTVSPGTCEHISSSYPSAACRLVYNPTFIALGDVVHGLVCPSMLLFGENHQGDADVVRGIWSQVFGLIGPDYEQRSTFVHVASYTEIELLKLSVNCALATKISLANSLGELFVAHGVDPIAVEHLSHDPRLGQGYFTPGQPISGPCLPRDNRALRAAGCEVDVVLPLSVATDSVNDHVVETIWRRVYQAALHHRHAEGPVVGIMGLAYKAGTNVTEASIGSIVHRRLKENGFESRVYDPGVENTDPLSSVWDCPVIFVGQPELEPGEGNLIGPMRKGQVIIKVEA